MSSRPEPKAHQVGDVKWIEKVQRGLLANEPGLGKTRSAIEATAGMRTLVIAPNLILSAGVWDDEIAKWSDSPDSYTQASYSMLNDRVKTGKTASSTKPVNRLRPEFRQKFDAVIIDEAHYVKGRKTSWTWATQEIAKHANLVVPMTGTPIPNWAHEAFTLLQLLYPEEAGRGREYGSFWRWAGKWFDCTPTRFSQGMPSVGELLGCVAAHGMPREGMPHPCLDRPPSDPCQHYLDFAAENFGDRYRRCYRKDCLDLPAFTEQTAKVPMTATQRRIYNELKRDFATEVHGEEVLAWSQGAKNSLMDLVTVSPWFLAPKGPPGGGKLDLLKFDLEARPDPVLVLAHRRVVVEACAAIAGQVGRRAGYIHGGTSTGQDAATVRRWRAGEIDVLVGSLEKVSEGLTLTEAATAIFVEKSYKPSRNEQATFRIYRMGQDKPVTIIDYVTPNSVDSGKRDLLATKNDRQMRTLTAADFLAIA